MSADVWPAVCEIGEAIAPEMEASVFGRWAKDMPDRHEPMNYDPDDGNLITEDNITRARKAAMALATYYNYGYWGTGESVETVVGDFLADLMHLCDALGIYLDERVATAQGHYEAELRGEL